MPDPQKLLKTLELARCKILQTAGRSGHFLEPQKVDDIFVVGDLHGNVSNFQAIYKKIELDKHPGRHLVLQELIHGVFRYPQGGDKSHQLVDLFATLKCCFPDRVHYLIGNHELAQWTGKEILKNEEDLNRLFDRGIEEAYRDYATEIRTAYNSLFAICPLGIRLPNRVYICHTLPSTRRMEQFSLDFVKQEEFQPEDFQTGGKVYANLWGRDTTAENAAEFLKRVDADYLVCGHIPCEKGYEFLCERLVVLDCAKVPGGYVHIHASTNYSPSTFTSIAFVIS
ncbi:metallophosphoesterase [Telmatocola sphagniphila]|uniref:protein-serine/threonine phosphatase n=1 Tax=Telmatocola sphagniphila TaxID=1123043 RepID=A0A8E6B7T2_9BACT|nr:metallophosphoesterase [Telmatocola sphagniphila]QVL33463.1 metallophosphoesterase [Telmatocola sphagniphila]